MNKEEHKLQENKYRLIKLVKYEYIANYYYYDKYQESLYIHQSWGEIKEIKEVSCFSPGQQWQIGTWATSEIKQNWSCPQDQEQKPES